MEASKAQTRLEQAKEEVGQVLGGRWKLTGIVGQGGMATVYKAESMMTGQSCAVKVLSQDVVKPRILSRFEREARILSSLNHTNVSHFIDFGFDERLESHYIVMELLRGWSLYRYVKRHGALPLHAVVSITGQIASALEAVGQLGVVHRDLKPSNIFLQIKPAPARAKLIDFGLAKDPDPELMLTRPGQLCGTALYMSPEMAQGHPIDHRSDLYSLGVILYELVTGRCPFSGGLLPVLQGHAHGAPPSAATLWKLKEEPHAELLELIDWLLVKDPDQRPQNARVVRQKLVKIYHELSNAGSH